MTDLWTEASRDFETERLETRLTTARVASAAVWPFLAAAETPADYANRKALVADRIERIAAAATEGDPALFSAVHAGLLDGLDEDFTVLHTERVATKLAALTASRAEQRRQAAIRAEVQRQTLREVLAGEVPPEFKEQQKKKGDGESDSEESSDSDEMPDFIKDKIEDDKKESRRRVASDDAPKCSECGSSMKAENGDGSPSDSDTPEVWRCPNYDEHQYGGKKDASRRTAGVYCNTHDVWVGDGNSDTHEGCSKEQKATEQAKESALRRVTCNSCGNDFEDDTKLGAARCPECDSSDLKMAKRTTAGENPFASGGPAAPKDQGNDNTKPVEDEQTGTWVCPNCQATDAYTQGGKDLKEALDAGEPIKCGSCQQVDSSGGAASQQQAPAPTPGVPGAQATRRQAAEEMMCPECGGDGSHPFNGNGMETCGTCNGTGSVPFSEYPGDRTFESKRTAAYVPATVTFEVRDNDRVIASVPTQEQAMRVLMQRGEWEGFGSTYDKDGNKTGDGLQVWRVVSGGQRGADTTMDVFDMEPEPPSETRIATFRPTASRRPFVRRTANAYTTDNPYAVQPPAEVGVPDDLTDGPTQPTTTRPRQAPMAPPAPPPVTQGFASRASLQETS